MQEDFKQSSYIQAVKKQMLLGEKPNACRRCYEIEDNGGVSKRYDSSIMFDNSVSDVLGGKKFLMNM